MSTLTLPELEKVIGGLGQTATEIHDQGLERLKEQHKQPDGSYLFVCDFLGCGQRIQGLNFQAFMNKVYAHFGTHAGTYNGEP